MSRRTRHHNGWNRKRGPRRSRQRALATQGPPGGLVLLAVAVFAVYLAAPPPADDPASGDGLGDRVGGWLVDYVVDVLEVVAETGGTPT